MGFEFCSSALIFLSSVFFGLHLISSRCSLFLILFFWLYVISTLSPNLTPTTRPPSPCILFQFGWFWCLWQSFSVNLIFFTSKTVSDDRAGLSPMCVAPSRPRTLVHRSPGFWGGGVLGMGDTGPDTRHSFEEN